jgi:hypothetical protein
LGLLQLGLDVEAIIGSVSRPEIGLHKKGDFQNAE